jgi:hypothetical protein
LIDATGERPMTPEQLASRHPVLYHMAESGSWPSIRKHGLLGTSALLDLFGIEGDARRAIESSHRSESVVLRHPIHGEVVIRDQKPLSEAKLRGCLVDMEPSEWYETLNNRVFFWLTRDRLATLLGARAYRGRSHTVLAIETARLLDRHLERVTLSPINSGSTVYVPVSRGRETFVSLHSYPDAWWRKRRLAELAVGYSVPDASDFVLSVEEWEGGQPLARLD